MAEQTVQLAPGESKQVSFEATPNAAKVYQVSVDGLSGSFKAIQILALVLNYTNPNNTLATHWDVYDLDQGKFLSAGGLAKRIGEAYVFVPQNLSALFLVFREAVNVFYDTRDYGPYVIPIAGLGEYTWDAKNAKLNGVPATSLMGTSGSIRGKVLAQENTNVAAWKLLTIQVLSASGTGSYFVGKTIKAEAEVQWSLVNVEIAATLKIQATSPGNYPWGIGFVLVLSSITYPSGLPDYLYAIDGGFAGSPGDGDSTGGYAIGCYSRYGLGGIPVLFKAYADGVQRNITLKSGTTYQIGSPGTQSLQLTLPSGPSGYWAAIYDANITLLRNIQIAVYLWTGTYWKGVITV